MKNYLLLLLISLLAVSTQAQNKQEESFKTAVELYEAQKFKESLPLFSDLETQVSKEDTLYPIVLWYHIGCLWLIENSYREQLDWKNSLKYALDCEKVLERAENYFTDEYLERRFWLYKNIILAYIGLKQHDLARAYQDKLYAGYKAGALPEGLDEYYNFDRFVYKDQNIWGYEWYEELPEDRFSTSFTKIVYYVYSRNKDGSDKEQLYRLHVLMFHNIDPSNGIDYVLTRISDHPEGESRQTLYSYMYSSPIDVPKLQDDIRKVLKGKVNTGIDPDFKNYFESDK